MKKLVICVLLLILTACNTSKQDIRNNAHAITEGLVFVKSEQGIIVHKAEDMALAAQDLEAIQEPLEQASDLIQDVVDNDVEPDSPAVAKLDEAADRVNSSREVVGAAVPVLENGAEEIIEAANSVTARVDKGLSLTSEIVENTDGVENTSTGLFSGIVSFFRKFLWTAIIIGIIILIGSLGLWPLITRAIINFMSGGFMLFRKSADTAALLHDARKNPTKESIEHVITHFRTGMAGEAAWRRVKRLEAKKLAKADNTDTVDSS